MEKLLKARGGRLLQENEIMLKFLQLCLALQHVHSKVRRQRQAAAAVAERTWLRRWPGPLACLPACRQTASPAPYARASCIVTSRAAIFSWAGTAYSSW